MFAIYGRMAGPDAWKMFACIFQDFDFFENEYFSETQHLPLTLFSCILPIQNINLTLFSCILLQNLPLTLFSYSFKISL